MNYVSVSVYHYISVVPVLDLQNIACYGICGHRLYKIETCALEGNRVFPSVFGREETEQIIYFCSTHLIS